MLDHVVQQFGKAQLNGVCCVLRHSAHTLNEKGRDILDVLQIAHREASSLEGLCFRATGSGTDVIHRAKEVVEAHFLQVMVHLWIARRHNGRRRQTRQGSIDESRCDCGNACWLESLAAPRVETQTIRPSNRLHRGT